MSNTEKQPYFLYPSSLHVSASGEWITTVLGSCVAVCLHDPVKKIGGMNHYMLPLWNGNGLASPKYGNIAIEKLLEKMLSMGCKRSSIQAKVFGGAEVIETNIKMFNIGERNIAVAFEILQDMKINVVAQSTGGKLGRKILFDTETGMVKQKYVQKQQQ